MGDNIKREYFAFISIRSAKMECAIKKFVEAIREETNRLATERNKLPPEVVDDQWIFNDGPLLRVLTTTVIVGVWHLVEKRLKRLIVLCTDDTSKVGIELSHNEFGEALKKSKAWKFKDIKNQAQKVHIDLKQCSHFKDMDLLRKISNSWKHQPSGEPNDDLITELNLDSSLTYDITEGKTVFEKIGTRFQLKEDDFAGILEEFLKRSITFLSDIEGKTRSSRQSAPKTASLNPKHMIA